MGLFSSSMAGLVALGVLTGGLAEGLMPEDDVGRRYGWTKEKTVSEGERTSPTKALQASSHEEDRRFVLREDLMPNSSPNESSQILYQRKKAPNGTESLVKIAEGVDGAKLHRSGKLFFVQKGTLYSLANDVQTPLADKSTGDFSFDGPQKRLAMVRLGKFSDPTKIDLLNEDGSLVRTLEDAGEDLVWAPMFTPDGKALIFLSSKTGFSSFYRAELDGSDVRQLTNQRVTHHNGGVFSQDFVPPLANPEKARFISESVLQYEVEEGVFWYLNVESGRAEKITVPTDEKTEGGLP